MTEDTTTSGLCDPVHINKARRMLAALAATMKPTRTAPCDQRAMLELAIGALVAMPCPFEGIGPFHGDHVSFADDECYAVNAGIHGDADYEPHCRACITEYLEEAVQPDPAVVVGGDVG